jgi:glycosyltransferase involved in cell wall biosynthesis
MKINQLLLHSPIGYTGYGVVGWNIARELYKQQFDLYVKPIMVGQLTPQHIFPLEDPQDQQIMQELCFRYFNSKAPTVKIWHQFDLDTRIGTGEYLAFPFFELDTFTENEKFHLSIPDKILVSSKWAKNILDENKIRAICEVVPLGVNNNIFDYTKYTHDSSESNDKYIFLNIGKWEVRKGHDILKDIFTKAFGPSDNVELWIAASSDCGIFSDKEIKEWHNYYNTGPMASKIKIIPRLPTQYNIADLISKASCGIFPSRAEGWNLELLEMMSMNKPVIATNYSAHTEFCDQENCMLINIDKLELAFDGKWFKGNNGNWAKFEENQIEQTVEYMRYVYKNNIRKNPHGVKTGQKFTWTNTVNKMLSYIG